MCLRALRVILLWIEDVTQRVEVLFSHWRASRMVYFGIPKGNLRESLQNEVPQHSDGAQRSFDGTLKVVRLTSA